MDENIETWGREILERHHGTYFLRKEQLSHLLDLPGIAIRHFVQELENRWLAEDSYDYGPAAPMSTLRTRKARPKVVTGTPVAHLPAVGQPSATRNSEQATLALMQPRAELGAHDQLSHTQSTQPTQSAGTSSGGAADRQTQGGKASGTPLHATPLSPMLRPALTPREVQAMYNEPPMMGGIHNMVNSLMAAGLVESGQHFVPPAPPVRQVAPAMSEETRHADATGTPQSIAPHSVTSGTAPQRYEQASAGKAEHATEKQMDGVPQVAAGISTGKSAGNTSSNSGSAATGPGPTGKLFPPKAAVPLTEAPVFALTPREVQAMYGQPQWMGGLRNTVKSLYAAGMVASPEQDAPPPSMGRPARQPLQRIATPAPDGGTVLRGRNGISKAHVVQPERLSATQRAELVRVDRSPAEPHHAQQAPPPALEAAHRSSTIEQNEPASASGEQGSQGHALAEVDLDELTDEVVRRFARSMELEAERRGVSAWD